MRSPNCHSENLDSRKFCSECGAGLQRRCARCGANNAPTAKFCGECGTPLGASVVASDEALVAAPIHSSARVANRNITGERRHLTVLFCDLVGSTAISAQLDPEEWREVVAGYHRTAAEAITRFGGHVAKYLGDGVMAYFGWPEAHDNDAERAARAGLAILDAITKLNQQPAIVATEHAVALAEKIGNLQQLATWITSKGMNALLAGDYRTAGPLAHQSLELAIRADNPANLGLSRLLQIMTSYWRGEFGRAEQHFAVGLELFNKSGYFPDPSRPVSDSGATTRGYLAGPTLRCNGKP
jgi:hypothetical protein